MRAINLFVTGLLAAGTLSASEYYVATNGSDAAVGTIGAPFVTIQHGVDQLGTGDTLFIRGGRYHEEVTVDGKTGDLTPWGGGTGWSGDWTPGADTDWAQAGGNTTARMVRDGSITRELASGVTNGTLQFQWDIAAFNDTEVAYAEVFNGSWVEVWSTNLNANGSSSKVPDELQDASVSLAGLGSVTQVRFRLNGNGPGDYFFVDDVQLGVAAHDFELTAAGETVTIRNYPGETVTLDGTEALTNSWVQHDGAIYKTTLTNDVWQLFVDEEMMTSARWPDAEAWTPATWDKDANWIQQHADSSDGSFQDAGTALAASGKDFTGAIAVMNVGSWLSFAKTVTGHSAGSDTFTYDPIGNQYHHKIENGAAFFEASYACLSAGKEWYFNAASNELYLIADDGLSPAGREIRGKTITYGLTVSNSQSVQVLGIDFFACTFQVQDSDLTVIEDSNVLFPSYSKRMLGDEANAAPTTMSGANNELRNCTFQYADGSGLVFSGDGGTIENCLFYQIDYSCVGTLHDVMVNIREASNLTFRHNTLDTGGNSVGIKGGPSSVFEFNRITNQGMLQHDGSAIQTDADYTDGTIMQNNWVHDHIKFALRFDTPWEVPEIYGTNGVMRYNVFWNTEPIVPKGDYHWIYGNTGFDNDVVDISIFSDTLHGGINSNTVTRNNAVNLISGSRSAAEPYPGISDHNWEGDDVKAQLVDPLQLDFRPAPGSALIDAGTNVVGGITNFVGVAPDIGAYEYGDDFYWIPGFQSAAASLPIPNAGSLDQPEGRELIYLIGYAGESATIYFGSDSNNLALLVNAPADVNVIDPRDYTTAPEGSTTYYWRVDTVLADSSVVTGAVWSYTTADYQSLLPEVIFSDNFNAYTGASPWDTQVQLGNGTIGGYNGAVRLLNTSVDDRTVFGAVDAFDAQSLLTLSFDSWVDGASPVQGPLSLSAGVATVSSGKNQARKTGIAAYSTTNRWHHFDWIVNQSALSVTYAFEDSIYAVAPGSADLWCDGVLVENDGTATPNDSEQDDSTLIDSFGWTVNKSDLADWRLDNVFVRNFAYVFVETFDTWAAAHSVADANADPDGDGLDNLAEYALGGNPTNGALTGHLPLFGKTGETLLYVYPRRQDSGLTLWLETSTNLVSGVWTNSGTIEFPTVGTFAEGFDAVTNQVPTDNPQTFIRLRVRDGE